MKKKAKYFCESCGSEVAGNAKYCPKCGKFFSLVRCSNCLYTDDSRKFIHGCPSCGYTGGQKPIPAKPSSSDGLKHTLSLKKRNLINSAFSQYEANTGTSNNGSSISNDVPLWLFGLSIIVLACIIFAIYLKL